MNVEGFFSSSILFSDLVDEKLDGVQKEIRKSLKDIKHTGLGNPWSENLNTTLDGKRNNIILSENWSNLISYISQANKTFCDFYSFDYELFIKESWVNFYDKGDYRGAHSHPGSVLSGVYFYQTNGEDGDLVFQNPNPLAIARATPFTSPFVIYKPKVGRLVLFDSTMIHWVNSNFTFDTRITVNFNIGVKR